MPIRRSHVECSVKLNTEVEGGGVWELPRSHSSFADDKAPADEIPKRYALNLLENKIICST